MGAAMRSLSRRQRQQHGSALARSRRSARRLSGKGFARLSDRRTQEPADGGHVRRADGGGCRQPRGALRAPEGTCGCVYNSLTQMSSAISDQAPRLTNLAKEQTMERSSLIASIAMVL